MERYVGPTTRNYESSIIEENEALKKENYPIKCSVMNGENNNIIIMIITN